jgi:hypothetical protein
MCRSSSCSCCLGGPSSLLMLPLDHLLKPYKLIDKVD